VDPRWKVCDLAEDEFKSLEAEGITLKPQEILDIQALALEAQGNFDDGLRLRGAPVLVGGVALWPMTIAGCLWRDAVEAMLDPKDYHTRLYVLAYAMANGRDPAALDCFGRQALRVVHRWARRLACGLNDLIDAVGEVQGYRPPAPESRKADDDDGTPGELAETAISIFGTNPDIWKYQLGIGQVAEIISRHFARERGGDPVAKRKTEALRRLAMYVDDVRKRHVKQD